MAAQLTQQTVVVSAVNFTEGGPLTVLRESLAAAIKTLPAHWTIIALVNNKTLIDLPRVQLIEIPDAKQSWARRLRWEWFGFHKLSRELQPDLWLSLHDITPRVQAKRQAVYCHNPAPFYQVKLREVLLEPKFLLFNLLYARLYRTLINRNSYVIVQQEWLREEFVRRFGPLPIVVAHPSIEAAAIHGKLRTGAPHVFFYPALARVFKNLEVLGEAARLLQARGIVNFEIRLTIDGSENRYAHWLVARYAKVPGMRFLGRQNPLQMGCHYRESSALLFPSRLETWGLPITEAKEHGLPMLVADRPYARETVGTYNMVSFFDPDNAQQLAELMATMLNNTWQPAGNIRQAPVQPFAPQWDALWQMLSNMPPEASDEVELTKKIN